MLGEGPTPGMKNENYVEVLRKRKGAKCSRVVLYALMSHCVTFA